MSLTGHSRQYSEPTSYSVADRLWLEKLEQEQFKNTSAYVHSLNNDVGKTNTMSLNYVFDQDDADNSLWPKKEKAKRLKKNDLYYYYSSNGDSSSNDRRKMNRYSINKWMK